MNLVQLEYLVALHHEKHFTRAAERCFVTQPTLSMQIKNLEHELGVTLFDRSINPIETTEIGKIMVAEAEMVLHKLAQMRERCQHSRQQPEGVLRLGIIPTLAPYLLPRFLPKFLTKYPGVQLEVQESPTKTILLMLAQNQLDVALLAGPIEGSQWNSVALFFEEFYAYLNPKDPLFGHRELDLQLVPHERILVLSEGHCFADQVFRLCSLSNKNNPGAQFNYLAGSFETIKKLVDQHLGLTFLPELATMDLTEDEQDSLKRIKGEATVRQIDLLVRTGYSLQNVVDALKTEIAAGIPLSMQKLQNRIVVPVAENLTE